MCASLWDICRLISSIMLHQLFSRQAGAIKFIEPARREPFKGVELPNLLVYYFKVKMNEDICSVVAKFG